MIKEDLRAEVKGVNDLGKDMYERGGFELGEVYALQVEKEEFEEKVKREIDSTIGVVMGKFDVDIDRDRNR